MVPVYYHTTWCHTPLNHYHKQYPALKGSFNACTLHPTVIDAYEEMSVCQLAGCRPKPTCAEKENVQTWMKHKMLAAHCFT